MRRSFLIIIIATSFCACNEDIKVNDKKLDELDAAGVKLQKTVKKGVDTVASKLKKLKNKLEDNHKDTTKFR